MHIRLAWYLLLNRPIRRNLFAFFCFKDYFPYTIQCIYLLRPNSWMQRALSRITILNEISCSHRVCSQSLFVLNIHKYNPNWFQLIVCRTLAELHEHFDASQLSKDLGGLIDFRLFEWIEQRAVNRRSISNFICFYSLIRPLKN